MRPLVYDFGQLNNATEKDYTRQIVKDRCTAIPNVVGQTDLIDSVADVLAWSQKYMRERNVMYYCIMIYFTCNRMSVVLLV